MLFESRDRVGVDSRTIGVLNTATNGIHEALSDSEVNGVHDTAHIDVDVPVLIIGGGPSGLLQAYLLSRLGGMYLTCVFTPDSLELSQLITSSQNIDCREIFAKTCCAESSCAFTALPRDMSAIWSGCQLYQIYRQSASRCVLG